jgi:hypothetical protein
MVGPYQTDGAVGTVDELARLTPLLGPLEPFAFGWRRRYRI